MEKEEGVHKHQGSENTWKMRMGTADKTGNKGRGKRPKVQKVGLDRPRGSMTQNGPGRTLGLPELAHALVVKTGESLRLC